MGLTVDYIQKPTYLHAVVRGENSVENVLAYAAAIKKECEARKCYRVLVEENLAGPRLDTMQIFKVSAVVSDTLRGFFVDVAYVDVTEKTDLLKFAEDVSVNRGFPFRVFATVAEAEKWLVEGGERRREDGR